MTHSSNLIATPRHSEMSPEITVVCVCYRSAAVVGDLLASIPLGTRRILVENPPDAESLQEADALDAIASVHGAEVLRLPSNLGFGAACNRGAALAQTPLVAFLNPDIQITDGALSALAGHAEAHSDAVAFNPTILDTAGKPSFKHGSILLPRSRWLSRGRPEFSREVPVLHGSALMVRRSAFQAIGGFDEALFLYHEDDDLSLRLARLGSLHFVREAVVTHSQGRSSPRDPVTAALKGWHMGRSRVLAGRKHDVGLSGLRALTLAVSQLASPVCLLSRRKRAKQLAFLRGVISSLRTKT